MWDELQEYEWHLFDNKENTKMLAYIWMDTSGFEYEIRWMWIVSAMLFSRECMWIKMHCFERKLYVCMLVSEDWSARDFSRKLLSML